MMQKVNGFEFLIDVLGTQAKTPAEVRAEIEAEMCVGGDSAFKLLQELLASTAIWLPRHLYESMPVLLPHVLRENDCRKRKCALGHKKKNGGLRDLWSTPSPDGYVRDDNSLIKALASSLRVRSADPRLNGVKIGRGWVACHIWPMATATDPWLNSFAANLVWLPKPVDILSDRCGHPVSDILRWTSLRSFQGRAARWSALTNGLFKGLVPPPAALSLVPPRNEFDVSASWLGARWQKVEAITEVLEARLDQRACTVRSGHSHFDLHVDGLHPARVRPLAERLRHYLTLQLVD